MQSKSAENQIINSDNCLGAHMVKNPPAVQETWVLPLSWEDSLEKRMATYSSILAWKIPWTEAWKGTVHSHKESDMN